ncbi:uncharacterized protein LOC103952068 isoform X5 [Pyrus x bretschneideri]|uniref:uncharacterized protein LOC103952068 isoform X5 n=1 Tax=Pyrus x bretschneideri TaxID=225117 RepID=UPI00202FC8E8|nr:uncharacterized protein LOC103952068 isoform X5 [Pyrus x bretschneideri]XP_048425640.1 uncharacterized protein LOC103952068 isoform X5 [Pyrus x bretschneideri]
MASKGPRSKLDHEPRAKRQKALEAAIEPHLPKAHWDHVLEEMIWLSKLLAEFQVREKMGISLGEEGCFKIEQGHARSGYKGRKEIEGGRATDKEGCTQYIQGCEEILAENRKAGTQQCWQKISGTATSLFSNILHKISQVSNAKKWTKMILTNQLN